tara:strand:- start:10214 stop:12013 length:1800 start_codon:yes stop_codon:yes gene_type:complete
MSNYVQNVLVKYGDFTFPAPTPFVSKSFSNQFVGGNIWATRVSVDLNGSIALLPKDGEGSGNNYEALSIKRNKIAEAFAGALSKNFLDFQVFGGGADFLLKNCTVDSVSFSESNYVGLVNYSITISGYKNDKDFLLDNYGVLSPVDSWQYSEQAGGATVTHTISAQGVNTNNKIPNAFAKAKAFVDSKKGTSNKVNQILIRNAHPNSTLILTNTSETVNRLSGSYSITENYTIATSDSSLSKGEERSLPSIQTANILTTYSMSFQDSHGSDFVSLNFSGSIIGNQDSSVTWDQVKDDFKSRDFYQLANKAYKRYITGSGSVRSGTGENTDLHKTPVTFSIDPNEDAKTINFQITYDNNNIIETCKIKNAESYFTYDVSIDHDNVSDIIGISISGTIITRGSLKKKNRDNKILLDLMLRDNHKIVRDEAQRIYNLMFPNRTQYVLSPKPRDISVSQDEFSGTISYSSSFSDEDFPENSSLRSLEYSIAVDPALQSYSAVPSCLQNGHYLIYNLNLKKKRESVNITLNAVAEDRGYEALEAASSEIELISDHVSNAFLDGDVIRLDEQNKVENKEISNITYSRSFSHEKAPEDIELNRLDN